MMKIFTHYVSHWILYKHIIDPWSFICVWHVSPSWFITSCLSNSGKCNIINVDTCPIGYDQVVLLTTKSRSYSFTASDRGSCLIFFSCTTCYNRMMVHQMSFVSSYPMYPCAVLNKHQRCIKLCVIWDSCWLIMDIEMLSLLPILWVQVLSLGFCSILQKLLLVLSCLIPYASCYITKMSVTTLCIAYQRLQAR